jgi:hypothetical protein
MVSEIYRLSFGTVYLFEIKEDNEMLHRLFFIISIFIFSTSILKADNPVAKKLNFENLTIYGKSNINNFSLVFDKNSESSPNKNIKTKVNNQNTEFLIPVERFKTDSRCIENDFLTMIQADKFPYIRFVIDNDQIELLKSENRCDSINAIITIASESKRFRIPIRRANNQPKEKSLTGEIELLLTDFNLSPISKFFGLVKVDNNVIIDFKINFTT